MDLAKLNLVINDEQARAAAASLDQLATAAGKADGAGGLLSKTFAAAAVSIHSNTSAVNDAAGAVGKAATAMGNVATSLDKLTTAQGNAAKATTAHKEQTQRLGDLMVTNNRNLGKSKTALGNLTKATGKLKTVTGNLNTATGNNTKAVRANTIAVEAAVGIQGTLNRTMLANSEAAAANTAALINNSEAANKASVSMERLLLKLSGTDKVTAATTKEMQKAANAMNRMANAAEKVKPATTAASTGMKTATKTAKTFGERMASLGKRVLQTAKSIALFAAGFAILGGIASGVGVIRDMEEAMAKVVSITSKSAESDAQAAAQKIQLNAAARELGATTRFTATQAAEGQLLLARAGFGVNEILEAQGDIMAFAAANSIELAQASTITANAIRQFGLETDKTQRVVDLFTAVAITSNTTVLELGQAMNKAAPLARSMGKEIEEVGALLGVLADQGIRGSAAGTNIRGVFGRLLQPVGRASEALDRMAASLGTTRDAFDITENSTATVFKNFKKVGAGASELFPIFGRLNIVAALIFTQAADELEAYEESLRSLDGTTKELSDAMEDTLAGSLKNFASAIQELVLVAGDSGLLGAMRAIVDFSTDVARALSGVTKAGEPVGDWAKAAAAIFKGLGAILVSIAATALPLMIAALGKSVIAMGAAASAALGLSTSVTLASRAVGTAIPLYGAYLLVVGGIVALTSYFSSETSEATDKLNAHNKALKEAEEATKAYNDKVELISQQRFEGLAKVNDRLEEMADRLRENRALLAASPGTSDDAVIKDLELQDLALGQALVKGKEYEEVLANLRAEMEKVAASDATRKLAEDQGQAVESLTKKSSKLKDQLMLLTVERSRRGIFKAQLEAEREAVEAYGAGTFEAAQAARQFASDLLEVEAALELEAEVAAGTKAIAGMNTALVAASEELNSLFVSAENLSQSQALTAFIKQTDEALAKGTITQKEASDAIFLYAQIKDKTASGTSFIDSLDETRSAVEGVDKSIKLLNERTRLQNELSLDKGGRDEQLGFYKTYQKLLEKFGGNAVLAREELDRLRAAQERLTAATGTRKAFDDQAKAGKELDEVYEKLGVTLDNINKSSQEQADAAFVFEVNAIALRKFKGDADKAAEAVEKVNARLKLISEREELVKLGQDIGRAFSDSLEDWVRGVEKGSDALRALGDQLQSIIFNKTIGQSLESSIGKIFGGFAGEEDTGTGAAALTGSATALNGSAVALNLAAQALQAIAIGSFSGKFASGVLSKSLAESGLDLGDVDNEFANGFAKGGAFTGGVESPIASAKGNLFNNSILKQPTLFRSGSGPVLGGEIADEAIMPLKRGADGSLGVAVTGGGGGGSTTNKTYNVNFNVTGDPEQFRRSKGQIMRDLKSIGG